MLSPCLAVVGIYIILIFIRLILLINGLIILSLCLRHFICCYGYRKDLALWASVFSSHF